MELGEIESTQEMVSELFLYIKYDRISGLSHCTREEIEGLYKYGLLNCYRFESLYDRSLCAQNLYDKLMEILFQREMQAFDMTLLEGKNKVHLKPEDVIPVVFNDTSLYVILIDIYTENNFPEQIFELYGAMKKHFYILHKQEEILQGMMTEAEPTTTTSSSSPMKELLKKEKEDSDVFVSEEHLEQVIQIEMEHIYEPEMDEPMKVLSEPENLSVLDMPIDPNDSDVLVPNFPKLSPKTFNQLVDACAYIGRIKDIHKILLFMIQNHIELTTETLNKTIKSCIPSGASYEALKFFDIIRENAGAEIKPNIETCRLLMKTCLEASDEHFYKSIYDGLKELVVGEEVSEADFDRELFMDYLLCKCALPSEHVGLESLELIKEHEAKFGIKYGIEYYNIVLQACAKVGDKKTALKILEATLKEYAAWKEATTPSEETSSEDVSPKSTLEKDYLLPTLETFNLVLKTMSFDADRRTIDIYRHLRKICRDIFKPNVDTYNAIISTEIRGGDVTKAKKILREIRARGMTPNITSFNELFFGYYKTDWEKHMKEFREKERTSVFKSYYERWEKEQNALREEKESASVNGVSMDQMMDEMMQEMKERDVKETEQEQQKLKEMEESYEMSEEEKQQMMQDMQQEYEEEMRKMVEEMNNEQKETDFNKQLQQSMMDDLMKKMQEDTMKELERRASENLQKSMMDDLMKKMQEDSLKQVMEQQSRKMMEDMLNAQLDKDIARMSRPAILDDIATQKFWDPKTGTWVDDIDDGGDHGTGCPCCH